VKVDVGQIEQVLLNLAVNARDAMPSGGSLTIETSETRVTDSAPFPGLAPARYATMRVKDTGVGMDDATIGRVFDPFFTTKPVGRGTGLGLATVFGIVKQSSGHVTVASRPGEGSTFTVYIPVCSAPAESSPRKGPATSADALDRGSETILLVEDEVQVRKLVQSVLRGAGYRVLSSPTATGALRMSDRFSEPIDLVVTDVVMPRLSGPQLAARLSKTRPTTKVLYVSGYMDAQLLDSGISLLRKPFTPPVLLRRVRSVLDGDGEATARLEQVVAR
jgi:CheY-like chemotaxis protein